MVFAVWGTSCIASGLEQANNVQHTPAVKIALVMNPRCELLCASSGCSLVYFAAVYLLINSTFMKCEGRVGPLSMRCLSIFDLTDQCIFVWKGAGLLFAINQRVVLHHFKDTASCLN